MIPSENAGYTPGRWVVQKYDATMKVWFDVGDALPEGDAKVRLRECREAS